MADFVPLREGSVITETVVHLVARRGDAIDPMGTGVVIAPHIVLTAKHVLSDYLRSLDGRELHDGMETRFSLMVIAQDRDGSNAYVFDARAMGLATHTDLALLWISPWSGLPSTFVWQYAGLELLRLRLEATLRASVTTHAPGVSSTAKFALSATWRPVQGRS